jgi:hypothetical protein
MLAGRHTSSVQDAIALLNCRRLPARLNATEAAVLLGFKEHDIAALVAAKLLIPLGKPAQNSPKYFAAVDIFARADDRAWLSQSTKALAKYWARKNCKPNRSIGTTFKSIAELEREDHPLHGAK